MINTNDTTTRIYQRIIQILALGHIVLGLAFPFLMKIDVFSSFMISKMFPGMTLSGAFYDQAAYVVGVFGPTVASWGVLLLVLTNSYFSKPTKQLWTGLVLAVLVWFIGDTIYSLLHGVTFALFINGIVALLFLIPIYKSRSLLDK